MQVPLLETGHGLLWAQSTRTKLDTQKLFVLAKVDDSFLPL